MQTVAQLGKSVIWGPLNLRAFAGSCRNFGHVPCGYAALSSEEGSFLCLAQGLLHHTQSKSFWAGPVPLFSPQCSERGCESEGGRLLRTEACLGITHPDLIVFSNSRGIICLQQVTTSDFQGSLH